MAVSWSGTMFVRRRTARINEHRFTPTTPGVLLHMHLLLVRLEEILLTSFMMRLVHATVTAASHGLFPQVKLVSGIKLLVPQHAGVTTTIFLMVHKDSYLELTP